MLDFIPQFGRLENPDERDALFPVSAILPPSNPFITEKYWYDGGWWGNQKSTSQCVAYSWMHWIEDGPVVQDAIAANRPKPLLDPKDLYRECQYRDPWPGTNYAGTSIRAAAKVLQELGVVKEYRWAANSNEIAEAILNLGPVIAGTKWFSNMTTPRANGLVKVTGQNQGGHAYLLNGVDTVKRLFRIKNSWGKEWGRSGYAFISFDDFDSLIAQGGEACIAFENKLKTVPSFSVLSPPTSA